MKKERLRRVLVNDGHIVQEIVPSVPVGVSLSPERNQVVEVIRNRFKGHKRFLILEPFGEVFWNVDSSVGVKKANPRVSVVFVHD